MIINRFRTIGFVLTGLLGISLFTFLSSVSGAANLDAKDRDISGVIFTNKMFHGPTLRDNSLNRMIESSQEDDVANCRYGVVARSSQLDVVPTLGAGWILKFSTPYWPNITPANNAERVHLIKTHQAKTMGGEYLPDYTTNTPLNQGFADYISDNPGNLWIIGNEVDRIGQGEMFPEIYAQAYHEVRHFIKMADPSARIGISGLVQVTPGRLQYLDMVWDAYMQKYAIPMPVDVWTMHVYVLPEVESDGITPNGIASVALGTNPSLGKRSSDNDPNVCSDPDVYCFAEHDDVSIFAEQVVAMRQWMKDHGQQQKPLVLSEYSILYPYEEEGESCFLQDEFGNCFTPQRIKTFMNETFDYLNNAQDVNLGYGLDDNRLVQQWIWYAVHETGAGVSSNLVQADFETLNLLGQNFRDRVYGEELYVNLAVDHVPSQIATIGAGGKATAQLSVRFLNNGNTAVDQTFDVTFYKDAALTQEIDSVSVNSIARGCASNYYTASVDWPNLDPGEHQFWVHIDTEDDINEKPAEDSDNIGVGTVLVNSDMIALPVVIR